MGILSYSSSVKTFKPMSSSKDTLARHTSCNQNKIAYEQDAARLYQAIRDSNVSSEEGVPLLPEDDNLLQIHTDLLETLPSSIDCSSGSAGDMMTLHSLPCSYSHEEMPVTALDNFYREDQQESNPKIFFPEDMALGALHSSPMIQLKNSLADADPRSDRQEELFYHLSEAIKTEIYTSGAPSEHLPVSLLINIGSGRILVHTMAMVRAASRALELTQSHEGGDDIALIALSCAFGNMELFGEEYLSGNI
jgi:hypothetical protein